MKILLGPEAGASAAFLGVEVVEGFASFLIGDNSPGAIVERFANFALNSDIGSPPPPPLGAIGEGAGFGVSCTGAVIGTNLDGFGAIGGATCFLELIFLQQFLIS